jgi:serine/threonine protein kinase
MIGSGTYSRVYINDTTAIKKIKKEFFESAVREICLIKACDHENIIKLTDVKYTNEFTLLFMNLALCNLSDLVINERTLLLDITKDIIAGIYYLHSRGIIHGDLKPENILIEKTNAKKNNSSLGHLKAIICDFGISVLSSEKIHLNKMTTTVYRAPEIDYYKTDRINSNTFTELIDIWSLGCILFELLTGNQLAYYNECEDSSIYAYQFLINDGKILSREERLNYLYKLKSSNVLNVIKKYKIQKKFYLCNDLIEKISKCLTPNPKYRINAEMLFGSKQQIEKIDIPNVDLDESLVAINIDEKILLSCSFETINLAEHIYKKIPECYNKESFKLAAFYIAASLYSNDNILISMIEDIQPDVNLYINYILSIKIL